VCETLDGGLAAVLRVGPGSHLEVRGKGWSGQRTTWRGSSPLTGRIHGERVVDNRIKPGKRGDANSPEAVATGATRTTWPWVILGVLMIWLVSYKQARCSSPCRRTRRRPPGGPSTPRGWERGVRGGAQEQSQCPGCQKQASISTLTEGLSGRPGPGDKITQSMFGMTSRWKVVLWNVRLGLHQSKV
jgi:hypothetical protein